MLDVFETLSNSLVSQSEDRVLSMIENVLRLVLFFKRFGGDLVRDLLRVVAAETSRTTSRTGDARHVRQAVSEVSQKQHATRRIE
jgi:hypothetical protein